MKMRVAILAVARLVAFSLMCLIAMPAQAQLVNITRNSDVAFGSITNLNVDVTRNQDICIYSSALFGRYSVTASGSGAGGAFTLSNGGATLAYEVQWSSSAGQTSGTTLSAGTALTGLTSSALLPACTLGPSTASLIVVLRSSALTSAQAGSYSGTLTLLIAPS